MTEANAAQKSTWVSVGVNVFMAVLQVAAGVFAHSQALIADGVHSLSDFIADFVVLVAAHQSQKAPDDDHPYGHQRYENAASLVLGVILLGVGMGMMASAAQKFAHPESIARVHVLALGIALLAIVCKETLFRYMLAVAKRVQSSLLVANAWHARSDAASSLVVSAGIIGNLLGYPLLDPIAALIVGFLVTKMGGSFAWRALQDLMDAAADDETVNTIRQLILAQAGVLGLHDLRTRKMGDSIVVDAHVEVDDRLTVVEGHNIAVAVTRALTGERNILNAMIHIDPVNQATGQSHDGRGAPRFS